MIKWFKFMGLGLAVVVTGYNPVQAASNEESISNGQQSAYPAMAVPLQPNFQAESNIAKLTEYLAKPELKDESRAQIYLQRGRYYDDIGLRDLARIDYFKSLKINPKQPEIYNLLGMYYTQIGQFDTAYQAFDSTIDLDPSNLDAVYNRAIAFYYADRYDLALEDMKTYYQAKPDDPLRALWLYIVQSESDKTSALKSLHESYQNKTDEWGWVLVGILLNEINEQDVSNYIVNSTDNNTVMAERFTEAYFYLGKNYMANGDISRALSVYKLALSLNVFNYNEHSYSLLELQRISKEYQAAKKSGNIQEFVKVN